MVKKLDKWELAIVNYFLYVTTESQVNAHNLIEIYNLDEFVEEILMVERKNDSENWVDKKACKQNIMKCLQEYIQATQPKV